MFIVGRDVIEKSRSMKIEELQTYQGIVESLKKKGRTKHLLLGNGFSMAYDAKIFSYNALSSFIENYCCPMKLFKLK